MRDIEDLEELLHGSIVASLNNPLIDTSYRRIRNYLKLLRMDRKMTVRSCCGRCGSTSSSSTPAPIAMLMPPPLRSKRTLRRPCSVASVYIDQDLAKIWRFKNWV